MAKRRKSQPKKRPGTKPTETSPIKIRRLLRAQAILDMRVQGHSLHAIGQAQKPPISGPRVFAIITEALSGIASESVEQVRSMEMIRLDELQAGLYEPAMNGDIAAVDRILAIMRRRAMLCGVDIQPERAFRVNEDGQPMSDEANVIRVEIIGNPELERTRWLEERVRFLEAKDVTPRTTSHLQ